MAAPTPREEYGYKAKIAKQAESYEEMVEFMEKVSAEAEANGEDLTVEERDLLLAAYENLLEATRASWRIISSIEQKMESRGDKDHVAIICDYRSKIESEFSNICDGMLELLDSRLIPFASSRDSKVFYLKVRRDYKRYLAEIKSGAEHKETADIALSHREKYLYMAKLAEQADRYHEMVEFIEKVLAAADSEDLMVEERNLLGVAYKRLIGVARASWRIISSMEDQEESLGNMHHVIINRDYRSKVESEVCNICDDILNLLDSRLIPLASTAGSKVFYFKMKGDYNRYLAEIKTGTQRKEIIETTLAAYKSGQDIANAELSPTHPFRLGLALNVSVFYYEILDSLDHALYLAKEAFDEAVAEMGTMDEESYEDSTFLLQLLRDNLNLWNSQKQDDE